MIARQISRHILKQKKSFKNHAKESFDIGVIFALSSEAAGCSFQMEESLLRSLNPAQSRLTAPESETNSL